MTETCCQLPTETTKAKLLLKLALIVGFLVFLNFGGHWVVNKFDLQFWPEHEHVVATMLWLAIAVYILWMALPFVPGVELGLALMMMLGPKGVVAVYCCTLFSLSLSFAIGRLIPLKAFTRFLQWLHLHKSRDLLLQMELLDPGEKIDFLLKSAPPKYIPLLIKHRYVLLAAILNLPGNALIGGGGGIGMIAGMSGLYPFPKYILLIAIAIAPLPLFFLAGKAAI